MKTNPWLTLVLSFLVLPGRTQPATAQLPPPGPYTITERGPHHRVWERVTYEAGPHGRLLPKAHRIVELTTGMHYLQDGIWIEASDTIESVPGGATARHGQHKVTFANNLATPGAIDLQTPDGKRLRSHILGLSYLDTATGDSVLIAQVKDDCQGTIAASNQVIYADAFTGTGVNASVRYTYTKAGLEQDVILHKQPPAPEAYGLSPHTTVLEGLTEFLDPPQPTKQTVTRALSGATMSDENLDFGAMKVRRGKAFSLGLGAKTTKIPVTKQWLKLEGRDFLIEQVPLSGVVRAFGLLPEGAGAAVPSSSSALRRLASNKRVLPAPPTAKTPPHAMTVAQGPRPVAGFVLDYNISGTFTNFTFQGHTTYCATDWVYLDGTTTIQGGAVIKYAQSAVIAVQGAIVCATTLSRPAVFTSRHDDSVGERIEGSTGNPETNYQGVCALLLANWDYGVDLSYLRFSYLNYCMEIDNWPAANTLSHCQFVHCRDGIFPLISCLNLRNVLMSDIKERCLIAGDMPFDAPIAAEHLTVSQAPALIEAWDWTPALRLTNSLLVAVTSLGTTNVTSEASFWFTNDPGVFQSAVAGAHYLADNSPYRNAGTTNINPGLLADLRTKTTYPPALVYSNADLGGDTVFSPQVPRDTDAPDLGYHYIPLDYIFSGIYLTNGTFTVQPGTALGVYPDPGVRQFGLDTAAGANLQCLGTAEAPIIIANLKTVQEQPLHLNGGSWNASVLTHQNPVGTLPRAQFRFTKWYALGNEGHHFSGYVQDTEPMAFANCEFFGGGFQSLNPSLNVSNCLFDRVNVYLEEGWADHGSQFCFFNNLFRGGICYLYQDHGYFGTDWTFRDNVFDGTDMQIYDAPNLCDHNAYIGITNYLAGTLQTNDIVLTSFTWLAGPLGDYYQPTNSPLLNAGSRTADLAGLYHYTVTTNLADGSEIKETNSIVDLGRHHVAVDANGHPVDTDVDGIPDYQADANGNGLCDPGEVCCGLLAANAYKRSCEDKFYVWVRNLSGVNLTGGTFDLYVYFVPSTSNYFTTLQPWGPTDVLPNGSSHLFTFCSTNHSITNFDCMVAYQGVNFCAVSPKFPITPLHDLARVVTNTTLMADPCLECGNCQTNPPAPVPPRARPECDGEAGVFWCQPDPCGRWLTNLHVSSSAGPAAARLDNFYKLTDPPENVDLGCPKRGFKNVYAIKQWHGRWPFNYRDGLSETAENRFPDEYYRHWRSEGQPIVWFVFLFDPGT